MNIFHIANTQHKSESARIITGLVFPLLIFINLLITPFETYCSQNAGTAIESTAAAPQQALEHPQLGFSGNGRIYSNNDHRFVSFTNKEFARRTFAKYSRDLSVSGDRLFPPGSITFIFPLRI